VQRTAVVTDSTARPVDPAVAVVALDVVVDGRAVGEDDTELADLLARMVEGSDVGTSRPSPDGFARAYEAAADAGASAVVSVHLSGALSGTVDAARLAAAGARLRVDVVDTGSVGAVLSAAVAAAARLAGDGADAVRVGDAVREVSSRSRTWVSPATASHLRRGGRAGPGQGEPRGQLSARHLLVVSEGRLVPLERVRTTRRLFDRLRELAAEHVSGVDAVDGVRLVVQHAGAPDLAARLVEELRTTTPSHVQVGSLPLSPVLAAHVGPGAIGVAAVVRPGTA
jgi:DegV family protein with EDD domain